MPWDTLYTSLRKSQLYSKVDFFLNEYRKTCENFLRTFLLLYEERPEIYHDHVWLLYVFLVHWYLFLRRKLLKKAQKAYIEPQVNNRAWIIYHISILKLRLWKRRIRLETQKILPNQFTLQNHFFYFKKWEFSKMEMRNLIW